jgi:hypothetical protein
LGNFYTQNNTGATGAVGGGGSGGGSAWSTYVATQSVNMCNYGFSNVGPVGIGTSAPTVSLDVAGQMRSRIITSNLAGTGFTGDFTSPTGNSVYYYITNSNFSSLALTNPGTGAYNGVYGVFKNATTTGLSLTMSYAGATGPASPLLLYSASAATLVWNGTSYLQF